MICALAFGANMAAGQAYPVKPIRIVTAPPGGGSDLVARVLAQGTAGPLGQPVVVENRAAGSIPGEIVSSAAADGYTLLVAGASHWLLPFLRNKVPYDPVKDFAPITLAVSAPSILVVHPALPVKSVSELIALAKAKPGGLNYASGSTGGANHIGGEQFKAMAGVNIVHVPYKGVGPALNALIGGEVQLSFGGGAAVTPHVKSGRLRALAVTSATPSALFPGLPTVDASGLPGYISVSMFGVFAPAKTPTPAINRLNEEMVRVLKSPDVKERLFNAGLEVVGSSPAQLATALRVEMTTLGKVIKDAHIRDE